MKRDGYIDGLYYFTMNTLDRKPFFRDPDLCELFMLGTELTMNHYGFDLEAYCVLPDHVHLLITLPDGVYDYSQILQDIRHVATRSIRYHCKKPDLILWSRGYWTHTIQSPRDYKLIMITYITIQCNMVMLKVLICGYGQVWILNHTIRK